MRTLFWAIGLTYGVAFAIGVLVTLSIPPVVWWLKRYRVAGPRTAALALSLISALDAKHRPGFAASLLSVWGWDVYSKRAVVFQRKTDDGELMH